MYKEISSQKVCTGCMACVDSCNKNAIVITNVGGSDQVWNPGTGMNIEPYFLSFTPKGKKRISYASSFGVTRIPTQYADKFKKLLNGLDFISVREEAGVKIVEEVAQRKAELVLDPTLLLDKEEWKKCSSGYNPNNEGYVIIYEVHPSEKIQQLALDYAQKKIYQCIESA